MHFFYITFVHPSKEGISVVIFFPRTQSTAGFFQFSCQDRCFHVPHQQTSSEMSSEVAATLCRKVSTQLQLCCSLLWHRALWCCITRTNICVLLGYFEFFFQENIYLFIYFVNQQGLVLFSCCISRTLHVVLSWSIWAS